MRKRNNRAGMSLVELIIVIGILGVIFAAVFLFFTKGTEQFHFTRRQNELATSGRLALEVLADEILWAGYMPEGGWTEDEWHPVETAQNSYFSFYADMNDPYKSLENQDYRNIFLDSDGYIHITDNGSMNRLAGHNITSLQFNYLDASGGMLAKPLNETDRDAVRHIVIKLTLQDTYMGETYQTILQTTVTPRNLGVVHNFNPVFYAPGQIDATIVVNVDGTAETHAPTADQQALLSQLDTWGFTLVPLADEELPTFDYTGVGVDVIILRDVVDGTGFHSTIAADLQVIPIPMIILDADDAEQVFVMGLWAHEDPFSWGWMDTWPYADHPIHDDLSGSVFAIYDTLGGPGKVTLLDSLYPGTTFVTANFFWGISGVSVMNEFNEEYRRIHYCAPEFTKYSSGDGLQFLYNVIIWLLPGQTNPPLGEEIVLETFEGDPPESVEMTFWEDSLEGGAWLPDSIVLYQDFQLGGTHEMMWSNIATGGGRIIRQSDNVLLTDRTITGGYARDLVSTVMNLSNYDMFSDDLYIRLRTWRGTTESIDADDGIFLITSGGIEVLAEQNFENPILGPGDITFWGDPAGRYRVHLPKPYWGGNSTRFVTLDSEMSGNYARNRMIYELDTSHLADSTTITVSYLMCDHGDGSDPYDPATGEGDYIGWSLGPDMSDPIIDHIDLLPGTQANGKWYGGNFTFMPTGIMPDTIFVVFGQYGDMSASSATSHGGLSFDDIYIVANRETVTLEKIATPDAGGGYNPLHVDLDDAAVAAGMQFNDHYPIALSWGGYGPWTAHGLLWKNFEVGYIGSVYNAPGWDHGPVVARQKDDWVLERILGDHKYTLHANFINSYSNEVDCWLESPVFSIPSGTIDPFLEFTHELNMENGWDFGWIEVSTNEGETWTVLETGAYNGSYDGHGAFTGAIPEQQVLIGMDGYAGGSVKLRFLFHSDETGVRDGWTLDNFRVYGTVAGVMIESIGFRPTSTGGGWFFDTVDLYLGRTADQYFTEGGELDKTLMDFCGTYAVAPTASEWVMLDLPQPFILLAGTNLQVKMEMNQLSTSGGYTWTTGYHPATVRDEHSPGGDPGNLKVSDNRPAIVVGTTSYGQIFIDADSTGESSEVPLHFGYDYSDFEAIYLMSEMGFTIDIDWIHGGANDDWQIGAPLFIPDIDPALTAANDNAIAGNDLTDNGYYNFDAWNWIMSPAYDMAEAMVYDSIAIAYDRCLRLALNDAGYIQIAFTDTVDPPLESDWITIADYVYQDDEWIQDVIQVTEHFMNAYLNGESYYFIRFLLYSGPFAEQGGWNIDNVGFFGRYAI